MSREKRESIPSKEMSMDGYEPFVNGFLNCHIPHHYNWLLGLPDPPKEEGEKRKYDRPNIPAAKMNGHFIHN